jgi:dephospho-CoA kinase
MLRVGLTGDLGSGKSTVARMLAERGAVVFSSDAMGRELMQPGEAVYAEIVRVFGPGIVAADGKLDRKKLAAMAFDRANPRVEELNAIVHPAVIEAQREWMAGVFAEDSDAVAVVESALIFEVERDARLRGESEGVLADWRRRFDRVVLVTAPDEMKIARYVERLSPGAWNEAIAADARSRLARQLSDAEKVARADFVLENTGDRAALRKVTELAWRKLRVA